MDESYISAHVGAGRLTSIWLWLHLQLEIPCGLAAGFPYLSLLGRRGSGVR